MLTIIFECHSTSVDNEARVSSGHFDAELSPLGLLQAEELGKRYKTESFDAVFCSNLKRSVHTADIAFKEKGVKIISDPRLAECNYGEFNRHPSAEVDSLRPKYIETPFPGGQSYHQTTDLTKECLKEMWEEYKGKRVMIVGHRATQYALENLINRVPLVDAITAPWKWRPGWMYLLEENTFSPKN
jgi:broad specificity phosphatase PhoE